MGDDRKDDVRIYIICFFFFFIGFTVVAIPWIVTFLLYLYRCFKPTMIDAFGGQFLDRNSHDNTNNNRPSSRVSPISAATPSEAVPCPSATSYDSVATHSQNNGGSERHVHFVAVMVVEIGSSHGSNSSNSQRQHYKAAVDPREEFSGELERKEQEEAMSESEGP